MATPVIRQPAPARAAAEAEQAERTVASSTSPTSPITGFSGVRRLPRPTNEPVKS